MLDRRVLIKENLFYEHNYCVEGPCEATIICGSDVGENFLDAAFLLIVN